MDSAGSETKYVDPDDIDSSDDDYDERVLSRQSRAAPAAPPPTASGAPLDQGSAISANAPAEMAVPVRRPPAEAAEVMALGNAADSAVSRGLSSERAIEEVTNEAAVLLGGKLSRQGVAMVAEAAVKAAFSAAKQTALAKPTTTTNASATADTAANTVMDEPPATLQAQRPGNENASVSMNTSAAMDGVAVAAPLMPPSNETSAPLVREQMSGESNAPVSTKPTSRNIPSAAASASASNGAADATPLAPPPTAPAASSSQASSVPPKPKPPTRNPRSSMQTEAMPSGERTRKRRRPFLNKAILAGPELYNHGKKLSASGLQIPTEQAVMEQDPTKTPSTVIKIRGVITGVPRPKYEKDWFDVKWFLKDKAVLQALDTKIPGKPRFRELLAQAMDAATAAGGNDDGVGEANRSPSALQVSSQESQGVGTKPSPEEPRIDQQATSEGASKTDDAPTEVARKPSPEPPRIDPQGKSKGASKMDDAWTDVGTKPSPEEPRVDSQEMSNDTSMMRKVSRDADPYWIQCKRCKQFRLLPDSARNDQLPLRNWYCKLNVYDPNRSSCDAPEQADAPKHPIQADGTERAKAIEPEGMKPEESAKQPVQTGSSKQSANEYQSYALGRPSLPANTKMNSNILTLWLFDVHVAPRLIKGGWNMSKKKRIVEGASDADVSQRSSAHYDFMFIPPGVEARAPFKKRTDYFDSRKGFMNYLESDKCKNDELSMYAVEFSRAVARILKGQSKQKPSGESFDAMAERIILKADKEAKKQVSDCLEGKQAAKRAPSTTRGKGSQEKATKRRESESSSSSSSDDEILSNLRTKKASTATQAKAKRAISEAELADSSSSDEEVLAKYRMKKGKKKSKDEILSNLRTKKAGTATEAKAKRAISEAELADSSSSDEEVLAKYRSMKGKKKSKDPMPIQMGGMEKALPRYIVPSEDVIQRDIVMPIIKEYRDSAPSSALINSDGTPFRSDEILRISVKSIPDEPDSVMFTAEMVMPLQSKFTSFINSFIERQKSKHGEETRPTTCKEETASSPTRGVEPDTVNAKYSIGTLVRKKFPGHGIYKGKVSKLPSMDFQYYSILYEDGDDEDIAVDQLHKYIVVDVAEEKDDGRDEKATANSSNSARGEAKRTFRAKFRSVRDIEYKDNGISDSAVNKSMWEMHTAIYGESCDDMCKCPSDLPLLTNTVLSDHQSRLKGNASISRRPVGFVCNFAPKFSAKVQKEFPESSPAQVLEKLVTMWSQHTREIRFGLKCRDNCSCGEGWQTVFMDKCLRPKICAEQKIPKKKRAIAEAGSFGGDLKSSQETLTIPKKRRVQSTTEQSHAPLHSTSESEINRRKRTETAGAERKTSSSTAGRLATATSNQMSQQREYKILFNPKEPLGFFVVTESRGNRLRSVCKITSVSPLTSKKDARLKPGTIVVAAGKERQALNSHFELREKYEGARGGSGMSGQLPIWFINTEVVAFGGTNAKRFRKEADWSSSGAWHGFSRVPGWPGGAKDFQGQQDQEGARQLKQSRRHMPSVQGARGNSPGAIPSFSFMPRPNHAWAPPTTSNAESSARKVQPRILHEPVERKADERRAGRKHVRFHNQLLTKHVPPEWNAQMMRGAEPDIPSGLSPNGNDALSYAVLNKDYRAVLQLLERDGAYANQFDSSRRLPMDYVSEMSKDLLREKQNLKMHSNDSEPLKKIEASIRDLGLKGKVLKIYLEAERVIELATYVKNWFEVELVVKAAKNLELTTRGRETRSSDFLFCTFTLDGKRDNRQTPKVPFSANPSWRNEDCPTYKVEINIELEDNYRKDKVAEIQMKGDASIPGGNITLGSWRETVEQIRYHSKTLEEKEVEGELSKGEFLLAGSLVVGMKPLELTREMLERKRREVADRLLTLINWIVAFRKETSTSAEKSPLNQASITIPMLHMLSLLHAAVHAADLSLVKRLLSLGADPRATSIAGSALSLAEFHLAEAGDGQEGQEEKAVFNAIVRTLTDASAASSTSETVEKGGKSTTDQSPKVESDARELPSVAAGSELPSVRTMDSSAPPIAAKGTNADAPATSVKGSLTTQPLERSKMLKDSGRRGVSNLPAWATKNPDSRSSVSSLAAETNAQAPSHARSLSSQAPTRVSSVASLERPLLPRISDKNWLPQRLGMHDLKNRLCRFYTPNKQGCFEGARCKFAHVYPEIGSALDSPEFAPSRDDLNAWAPAHFVFPYSSRNERGEEFWTAAFCHVQGDSVIYYAERGPQSRRSPQGIYFFSNKESAILAVRRKVFAVVRPDTLPLKRKRDEEYHRDDRRGNDGGEARRARRSTSPVPSPKARPKKILKFEPPAASGTLESSTQDKSSLKDGGGISSSKEKYTQRNDQNQQPPKAGKRSEDELCSANTTPPSLDVASVSELPKLPDSNWVGTNRRAHPPIGSVILDNDSWCRQAVMEMEGDHPDNYQVKEKINDAYSLFYTAAFVCPQSSVVYYAERGRDGRKGDKGIYWYPTESSARASVKRVVAAAQKMKRDAAPAIAEPNSTSPPASGQVQKPAAIIYTDGNKAQRAVHEDSSISNMSIDESSTASSSAEKNDNSELPQLSKYWVENKTVRCRFYNQKGGCKHGTKCRYAHVHPPLGSSRLKRIDPSQIAAVPDKFIHRKGELTSDYKLFYTAAYLDPSENVIYHAEGGKEARRNQRDVYFYNEEAEATDAVKRVVAASRGVRQGSKLSSSSPSRRTEALEDTYMKAIMKEPNLQVIFARVFPGHVMKRTCWTVKLGQNDGMVAVAFTPPPDIGFPPTQIFPSWRGGVLKGDRLWYQDERTAKAAALMKFFDLCAKRGLIKDTRHANDGRQLF